MLTCTKRLDQHHNQPTPKITLSLSATERTKTNYRWETPQGESICFRLPRGTLLQHGDLLQAETGEIIKIEAKSEPVITVTANSSLMLLQAAYHLGNRHVPLEIKPDYLRFTPDSVLEAMLQQLGLTIISEIAPFFPETGAYHQH